MVRFWIWVVFIVISSLLIGKSPVPIILFLLGLVLVMNGLIIKFKPQPLEELFCSFLFSLTIKSINYLIVNMIGVSWVCLFLVYFYINENSG